MPNTNSNSSRREFLATAATGLMAAGMATLSPMKIAAQDRQKNKTEEKEGIVFYRDLGKSGISLPIVSMGVMNADNPSVVQAAYELGIRHFDTAAGYQYGRNEQMVGTVIKKLGVRDKVVIGTKFFTPDQRQAVKSGNVLDKMTTLLNGSLRRLKMDYVDILYIHSVSDAESANHEETIKALETFKKQGKIKLAGLSTHSHMADVINAAVDTGFYDVVLSSINLSMDDDTNLLAAIKKAHDKGVGIIAMKTMAGGSRLTDPQLRDKYTSPTIITAALKWVLRNENITTCIAGFDNHEHMRQDFSVASDLEYNDLEKEYLNDSRITLGMGFCRQCQTCLAACPKGVDVPSLMRTHMYAAQYGNFHQARMTLDKIPAAKGLANCTDCTTCAVKCVNSVNIQKRLDELKLIYA